MEMKLCSMKCETFEIENYKIGRVEIQLDFKNGKY